MKIAVLQFTPEAKGQTFWNPAGGAIPKEDHEFKVIPVKAENVEADVQAHAKSGFDQFIVQATSDTSVSPAIEKAVSLLQSLDQKVVGPLLPSSQLNGAGAANGTAQGLSTIAFRFGPNIIVFGPAIEEEKSRLAAASLVEKHLKDGDIQGAYGVVRVDLSAAGTEITKVERNPQFYSPGASSADDKLADQLIPGTHSVVLDWVIAGRLANIKDLELDRQMEEQYAEYAPVYDDGVRDVPYYGNMQMMVQKYDWSGTVYDLGCGTGLLGGLIKEKGLPFKIWGVDLSSEMLKAPAIGEVYEKPVIFGRMEAAMMDTREMYDHVVSFGTVVYLAEPTFKAVLSRMFQIARKSVSLDIEDTTDVYLDKHEDNAELIPSHNHTAMFRRFQVPSGWKLVHDQHKTLYYDFQSENTEDIYTTVLRFEKQDV